MKFFRECVIEGEQEQTDINKPRSGISKWNERYEAYIESEAKRLKVSVEEVITHELFKHPTLSFADIPHDKLHPLNLSWINLAGVRFKDREVNDVNFTGANLDYAEFQYWYVTNVNFYGASLYRTNFEDASLLNVRFPETKLVETRFRHARLNNCSFPGSILIDINFSNSNLNSVDFSKSLIINCEYSYSIQDNVEYADSAIYNCQFEYVSINHSNFISADISPLDKDRIASIRNNSPREIHGDRLKRLKDRMLNTIQLNSVSTLTKVPLTKFVNSKLTQVQYDNTNLFRCSFGKVMTDNVSFKSAKIIKCIFAGTELNYADFSFANILSTDYVQASQTNTIYHFSKIINCFFTTSSLTNVRVYGAHLIHINYLEDVENVIKIYENYYDTSEDIQVNSDELNSFLTKWEKFIDPYIAYDSEKTIPSNEPIGYYASELRNVDYSAAILLKYDFSLSCMYNCMFRMAHLFSCNFGKTNAPSLHLQQAKISKVDFSDAKLTDANLSHSEGINRCGFESAELSGADFSYSERINRCRFDGATLTNAVFSHTERFNRCRFDGADLTDADFSSTKRIKRGGFDSADLTDADFSHTKKINGCSFNKADLTNASFVKSKVSDCEFTNTILSHTVLPDNYDWNMFYKGHRFTIPAHSFNVELIALSVILIGLTIPMTLTALFDIFPTGTYLLHTVRCGFEIILPSSLLTGMIACILLIIAIAILVYPVLFIIQYERYRLGMNDQDFLSWINKCYWVTGCCILILSTLWITHFMAGAMCETLCMFTLSLTVLGIILAHRIPGRIYFSIYEKSVISGLQEKKKE